MERASLVFLLLFAVLGTVRGQDFVRTSLPSSSAVCNDGTPASIYLRVTSPSEPWIVYLQGGFQCSSPEECRMRGMFLPDLVTSRNDPPSFSFPDESIFHSPPFENANAAYLRYCSSDSWLGEGQKRSISWRTEYTFAGRTILESAIAYLIEEYGMGQGLTVLSGCSAGGRGMAYNLDNVCQMLSSGGDSCVGILDAAFWDENAPGPLGSRQSLVAAAKEGVAFWGVTKPILNKNCTDSLSTDDDASPSYRCMFGNAYSFIQSPILLGIQQDDSFFIDYGLFGSFLSPNSPRAQAWAAEAKATLRNSINATFSGNEQDSAVFGPSCFSHCSSDTSAYSTIEIAAGEFAGASFQSTAAEWLAALEVGRGLDSVMLDSCDGFDCSVC